jgi:hypothetical protein
MTLKDRVFNHPYLYSSSVVAKACTIFATVIWALVVVSRDDALSTNKNYVYLLDIIPNENVWGGIALAVSAPLLWRLLSCGRPRVLGVIGYAVLALLWTYLWWGIVINGKPWPTGAAASSVVAALSLYAFISNPRDRTVAHPPLRKDGACPLTGKPCGRAEAYDHGKAA